MSTTILGLNIFNKSKKEFIDEVFSKEGKIHIISGNPEVLTNGLNSELLLSNFISKQSMIIPDGIGVVISSKIVREPVKEKIAGIEVMAEILNVCETTNKSVYLIGSKQEILDICVKNIKKKYPELVICGSHDGYFDLDSCEEIVQDIDENKPYAIFVAMGSPRQEIFIAKYFDKLNCSILMGVGGCFDVYANKVKRAPQWMINCGIEWLYRVCKEPVRIKRLFVIPKFMLKVFVNKYIIKDEKNI